MGAITQYPHEATQEWVQYERKVSRQWRDGLLSAYPVLRSHENAEFYLRMIHYLLFPAMWDHDNSREEMIVLPATVVASMAGKRVGENGFRAIDYIHAFERDMGWSLGVVEHIPNKKARMVRPQVPEAIIAINDTVTDPDDLVWFVSGRPVTAKSSRKVREEYERRILSAGTVLPGHPAYELAKFLNAQSNKALATRVRSNLHVLESMWAESPSSTNKQWLTRQSVRHTLDVLRETCRLDYRSCRGTARIHAKGVTIHCLPRAFRKAALGGAVEVDIRSSQFGIVARLWGLQECSQLIRSGDSVWQMFYDYLDVGPDQKDALKGALYAACFGMGRDNLQALLADGDKDVEGIGSEKASQFFRHPIIAELLDGRTKAIERVKANGGITDAFGLEFSTEHRPAYRLLAVEAQSWELRLMLPVWETVRGAKDVTMLSWLHDGCVIYHRDQARSMAMARKCKAAFDTNAEALGFACDLEWEPLG